ncbi:MAG: hypothetical protein Hyperionvirus33_14 [Hyperionvirus sp.]|uniref:Uncharacterized protein n=1 Tax=Hyperionvirus sp. TaxID=2487770 RepID=A0A3G5AEH3_9VIRU|nr:MAG: hypothetical protein Hyperionvirus33_14 [Hyperionvirus sp.]
MSLPEYSHMFSDLEMSRIRYGHASVWHLCVTILTEMEQLKSKDGIFHKTIVEKLETQFKVVQELEKLIQENFSEEFIKLFTRGPQNYDRYDGANNVFMDQIKLGTLGRGLMARFNWAICRLFRNNDPKSWNPYDITFNRLASTTLSDFADSVKNIWNKMPNTFGESFGEAVKHAVAASKEDEKRNPREQRQRRKVMVKGVKPKPALRGKASEAAPVKVPEVGKAVETVEPVKGGEPVEPVEPAEAVTAKPVENVWRKRMDENDVAAAQNAENAEKKDQATETTDAEHNADPTAEGDGGEDAKPEDWETVTHKRTVDLEIEIGGKKFLVKAKVLPNGKYKQVGDKKPIKQYARR